MSIQFQYYDTVAHGYTGILTVTGGVLVTDGSGVPSFSTTLPAGVQTNINAVGTITSGTWNAGPVSSATDSAGVYPVSTTEGWALTADFGSGGLVDWWNTSNVGGGFSFHQKTGASSALTLITVIGDPTFAETDYFVNNVVTGFIGSSAVETYMGTVTNTPFTFYPHNLSRTVAFYPTGGITLDGATSGTLTLTPPAVAGSSIVTLPAGTTNFSATGGASQVVKQDTAGGAFTVGTVITSGLTCTATNDNAAAGKIGEYVVSNIVVASGVALTTATPLNVTSISLTAGDWDARGTVAFSPAAGTLIVDMKGGINTVTNTLPTLSGTAPLVDIPLSPSAGIGATIPVGVGRLSLGATTTVYLVAQSTFTVSTCKAYGFISARRVR